ncbi:MAG: Lrp/AsnC ligand binding domain-containing protein [Verrucomicrobiota bacterium]|nr:Lrp/AsnC ligand binding domain-containing protein [Verrucomicrobiota bacterium]
MVTAIVLINVERKEVKKAVDSLMGMEGITEVYPVAGEYDMVAMIRVKDNHILSKLITEKITHMESIHHTKTLFALGVHSKIDLDKAYNI